MRREGSGGRKDRLDAFLSEKGYSASREKAKREILAGWVKVNGETVRDPSRRIEGSEKILVERPGGMYVSRGGEKLKRALASFHVRADGKTAADLGASTGGFTDCLLKSGAKRVYAVDVGYGQLDYSLRRDERVVAMERTHVNMLVESDFPDPVDLFTADLSFISITKVIGTIRRIFPHAEGVILVKPQFEAGPGEHKKGVVRKIENHKKILLRVVTSLAGMGVIIRGLDFSPLKGPRGNIEFLLHVSFGPEDPAACPGDGVSGSLVEEVVERAHRELGGREK